MYVSCPIRASEAAAANLQGYTLNLGYDIYVGPNAQFIDVNESTSYFSLCMTLQPKANKQST